MKIRDTNGIIPITCIPPVEVELGENEYRICIGMAELPDSPSAEIPAAILEHDSITQNAIYRFKEYAYEIQDGALIEVDLAGQTIDWSMSDLDQAGTLLVELGIIRPYKLVPKYPTGHKFTFLRLELAFDDVGVTKPASWIHRRKVH